MEKDNDKLGKLIEEATKSKIDPVFAQKLKEKIELLAPKYLKKRFSFFNHTFMLIRFSKIFKPSFAASLLILAIMTYTLVVQQKSPEEILEKVYAYYDGESQMDGIIYEKALEGRKNENGIFEFFINEGWHDNYGNILSIDSDLHNGEILDAFLLKTDSIGRTFYYDLVGPENEADLLNPFFGDSYYCLEIHEDEYSRFEITLQITENFTDYRVFSSSEDVDARKNDIIDPDLYAILPDLSGIFPELYGVYPGLYKDGKTSTEIIKKIVKKFKDYGIYDYKRVQDGGRYYDVFIETASGERWEYFDINTGELMKTEVYSDKPYEIIMSREILEKEILDFSEGEFIFDPVKYDLKLVPLLSADAPSSYQETGCYDLDGSKMSLESEMEFKSKLAPVIIDEIVEMRKLNENPEYKYKADIDVKFILPVPSGSISQPFNNFHKGIDIAIDRALYMVSMDENVRRVFAPADGKVLSLFQEEVGEMGVSLLIDHGDGLQTVYRHIGEITVKEGDNVSKGQIIGILNPPTGVGPQEGIYLHWEVKINGENVDPLDYIQE